MYIQTPRGDWSKQNQKITYNFFSKESLRLIQIKIFVKKEINKQIKNKRQI